MYRYTMLAVPKSGMAPWEALTKAVNEYRKSHPNAKLQGGPVVIGSAVVQALEEDIPEEDVQELKSRLSYHEDLKVNLP